MRGMLACVLGVSVVAGSCGGPGRLDPERERRVVQVGEAAAQELAGGLIGELTAALDAGGPAGAIEFCATEAGPLTRAAQEARGEGIVIKRTSSRVRNPANAPDPLERMALRHFESALAAGDPLPERMVQVVSDSVYRYYKPLVIAPLCVQCHGPRDALERAVRQALERRYPEDAATGYAPGDLRGLIRVSIPARIVDEG